MAEAAVDQRPNRFFCHQCSVEISPNLPDYTCPRCQSGFIEEMPEDSSEPTQTLPPNDPAQQFVELFGRSFLQSFQQHVDHRDPERTDSDTDDEGDLGIGLPPGRPPNAAAPNPFPPLFTRFPRTRISIRTQPGTDMDGAGPAGADQRNQALHGILQSLLSGLMGGPVQGGGEGTAGVGAQFPFGNMFTAYGNPGDYAWGAGGLDNIITQLLNQIEGTGPPPADKADIEGLKEIVIGKEHTEKTLQCSVCMDDFKLEEQVKMLSCDHCYHKDCIVPWLELHGTCPVCRKPVSGNNCDSDSNQTSLQANSRDPSNPSSQRSHSSRSRSPRTQDHQHSNYYADDDEYD